MKEKTCCFTGHRDIPADKADYLRYEVQKAIEYMMRKGITDFWCGGALGFDTLAAEEVLKLKDNYPEIKLFIAMPCPTQSIGWNEKNKAAYDAIAAKADSVCTVSDKYYQGCMQKRNRFMIDNSSRCIAYFRRGRGGTYYTVKYARDCGVEVYYV